MLKTFLVAASMTAALPVLAQQAPATSAPAPATPQTAPATADPAMTPADPAAQTAAPMAQADPAAAQPAPATDVASIVESEFGTYDKDGNGSLSRAEFATWVNALKTKADPSAKADKKYDAAAFKQADADKSKSVSKEELATFLGNSAGSQPS